MIYNPPPIMAAYDWARGLALGLGWFLGCGAWAVWVWASRERRDGR